jgi:hypothetical protein
MSNVYSPGDSESGLETVPLPSPQREPERFDVHRVFSERQGNGAELLDNDDKLQAKQRPTRTMLEYIHAQPH